MFAQGRVAATARICSKERFQRLSGARRNTPSSFKYSSSSSIMSASGRDIKASAGSESDTEVGPSLQSALTTPCRNMEPEKEVTEVTKIKTTHSKKALELFFDKPGGGSSTMEPEKDVTEITKIKTTQAEKALELFFDKPGGGSSTMEPPEKEVIEVIKIKTTLAEKALKLFFDKTN